MCHNTAQMDNKSITAGADKHHKDIRAIIEAGRKLAYDAVGQTTVATYSQIVQMRLRNLTWSHLCIIASVPTQEELRREIEQQKEFFRLQNE